MKLRSLIGVGTATRFAQIALPVSGIS